MPISDHLHNFLDVVQLLDDEDFHGENGFYREFQELKQLSAELRLDIVNYPTKNGQKETNRKKNRYKDILPFDKSRVLLPVTDGTSDGDYINANYIRGASGRPTYIAAQGPLQASINDFWRMLWAFKIEVVVMACKEYEVGKHKCQRYWCNGGETKQFGDISVELEQEKHISSDFVVRILRATNGSESRTVTQFHYNAWPDHGVPKTLTPIFDMIALMRESQSHDEIPLVIHCSAGCGRTGTICAIDFAWSLLKMGRVNETFSLFDIIASMRRQRHSLVQTKEQYELVHHAVKELFEKHLDIISKHNYQNVNFGDSTKPIQPPGSYENFILNPSEDETSTPSDAVIRKTSINLIAREEGEDVPLSPTEKSRMGAAPPPKPPLTKKPSVGPPEDAVKPSPPTKPVTQTNNNVRKSFGKSLTQPTPRLNDLSKTSPSNKVKTPSYENFDLPPPTKRSENVNVENKQPDMKPKADVYQQSDVSDSQMMCKDHVGLESPSVDKLKAAFEFKSVDVPIQPDSVATASTVKNEIQTLRNKKQASSSPGERRKFSLDSLKTAIKKVPDPKKRHTLKKSFQPNVVKVEKTIIPSVVSQSLQKNTDNLVSEFEAKKLNTSALTTSTHVAKKPNNVTLITLGASSTESATGQEYCNVSKDISDNLKRIEGDIADNVRSGIIDASSSSEIQTFISLKPAANQVVRNQNDTYESIFPLNDQFKQSTLDVKDNSSTAQDDHYAYAVNAANVRGPMAEVVRQQKAMHENMAAHIQGQPSAPPRRKEKKGPPSTSEDVYEVVGKTKSPKLLKTRTFSEDEPPPTLPFKTPEAYKSIDSPPPVTNSKSTTLPVLSKLKLQHFFKRAATDQPSLTVFHEKPSAEEERRLQKGVDVSIGFGARVGKPVGPRKQPEKWAYF